MATNIGPKIGIEGEASYRKQMNQIIAQAKELDSEMKLVTSSFNKETSAEEKNTRKKEVLTKQIKNQQERIKALSMELEKTAKQYGENDTRTVKLRTSLNNANTVLNKMTGELNDVEREMQEAGRETDQTTDKMNQFGNATDDAGKKTGGFSAGMQKAGAVLGKAVAAAAAAAAAAIVAVGAAMVKASVSAGKYADEILTLSQTSHLSTETLQEFKYAAELIDVDLETITGALSRNIRSMKSAASGTKETAAAYDALGVSVTDADGNLRNGETVFWELIDALGQVENETERDALAMTIFGRSAQELNPLLNIGSQGFAEYAKEAHDLGAILDDETLGSLGGLDDSLQRLRQSGSAAKNVIGGILAPALTNLANTATTAMADFTKATASGGLVAGIKSLSKSVKQIATDIAADLPAIIEAGIGIVVALAQGIGEAAPEILVALVTVLSDPALYEGIINAAFILINGLLEGLNQALPILLDALPAIITSIVLTLTSADNLGKMLQSAVQLVLALYNGIIKAIPELIKALPEIIESLVGTLTDPKTLVPLILAMPEVMAAMIEGLFNAIPALIQAGKDLIDTIGETITSGDFAKWGRDIIDGFVAGFRAMFDRVRNAAKNVADIIKGFLHFSRPDEGPLRDYEKWMPDMMRGITNGIEANKWRVREALNGLAGDMAVNIRPNVGALSDAAGASASRNYNTNVGGITVQVYGTEGQSVDALADKVMDRINISLQDSGRVWA